MHRHRPSRDPRPSLRRVRRLQGVQALEQRCLLAADLQGDEFRVNDYIAGTQRTIAGGVSAAASLNDDFIVAFGGRGTGDLDGVFSQRYDSQGAPLGGAVRVNTTTIGEQIDPSVAGNQDGNYVVVWAGRGAGDREGVFGQRYGAGGQTVGGEFLVNSTVGGVQGKPSVAMGFDGRFVVVWTGNGTGDSKGIFMQRFNADGTRAGGETRVNVTTAGDQSAPSVGLADDGGIVVVWTSITAGNGTDVFARRYAADGTATSGEFRINTSVVGDQELARVGVAGTGRFMVAWQSVSAMGDAQIAGQFFNADGTPDGAEKQITNTPGTFHGYPQVAMADNGVAAVTWSTLGSGANRWDVFSQFFNGQGAVDGATFRVNRTIEGGQRFSSLALSDTGEGVVAWTGNGQNDANGVFAQRVRAGGFVNQPPDLAPIPNQNALAGQQLRIVPAATDPDGPVGLLTWQFDPNSVVPEGLQIDPTTGVMTWTPTQSQLGVFTVRVLVTDSGRPALADAQTFTITVAPDLTTPSFTLQMEASAPEDSGTQTVLGFATNIRPGGAGNPGTGLSFIVTSTDSNLADVLGGPPVLLPNGTLQFTPKPGANGTANFSVVLNDSQAVNFGGVTQSPPQTFRIVVQPVNSAPQNIVLFAPSVPVEAGKTALFSGASPLRIAVQDSDAGTSEIEVSLVLPATGGGSFSVPAEALAAAQTIDRPAVGNGPTFTLLAGDGVNDTTLRMRGSLNQINFVLSNLRYDPPAGILGLIPVTMTTNDLGNTGTGGAKTDTTNFSFNVQQVNQPPVNNLPAMLQIISEGGSLRLRQITSNGISISDADAGTANVQVNLTVVGAVGTMSLAAPGALPAGVSLTIGDGTDDATMRLVGPIAGINQAIDDLTFKPVPEFFGTAQIAIVTSDLGNSGSGGPRTDSDNLDIMVRPVNDAPTLTVPGAQQVDERGTLTFNTANTNLISVADQDALNGLLEVTLSTPEGILSLSNPSLVLFNPARNGADGDGRDDAFMLFRGTLQNINNALNGLTYRPSSTLQGGIATKITIHVSDLGNTGENQLPVETVDGEITVNIVAMNDAPRNNVPTQGPTGLEDTNIAVGGLSIVDDSGDMPITVMLQVNNGTLLVDTTVPGGVAVGQVGGNQSATVTLNGTLAEINATLATANGLVYRPTADFTGSAQLTITTNDNGNTGLGGARTDVDTLSITVSPVNDAPTITAPATATADNPEPLLFTGGNAISVQDIDVGSGTMEVKLTATMGTLTLGTRTGLTFAAPSDGIDDAVVTMVGTRTNINNALASLLFSAAAGVTGNVAALKIEANDLGNTGTGGALSAVSKTVNITVTPVNNAPVVNLATNSFNANEGVQFSVTGVSVSDTDAGTGLMRVTLTAVGGTLSLATNVANGVQGGQVTGNNSGTVVVTASLAAINTTLAAAAGLQFTPTATTGVTINVNANDQGNFGDGGEKSNNKTITVNVTAGNRPPVNSIPSAAQTVAEEGTLTFSAASSNLISISDPDAGTDGVQVQISALHGTLSLSGVSGLTFSAGDGANDASMTFKGKITDINTALAGLTYRPETNFNGSETLTIKTDDLGKNGTGGPKTDSDDVTINVTPVNDAPTNTVPAAQTTAEDSPLEFSGAGKVISVADIDADPAGVRVTLSVANGTLTLSQTTGLTFLTGDGTADPTIKFSGKLADVNAALGKLTYSPSLNFSGNDTLTIITNDLGNTGAGGALEDTDTVTITVTAVNDAPRHTLPGTQNVAEDGTLTFNAQNNNLITVADDDAGTNPVQVTLTVTSGKLNLGSTANLTGVTGNGTASVSFAGPLTAVNAALNGMTFMPAVNVTDNVTLSITTNDQGNSPAPPQSKTDTLTITINPVNDGPVVQVPGAQTVAEDTNVVFSAAGGRLIQIVDVDAADGLIGVTLGAMHGLLTLSQTTGLTFTGGSDGVADAAMSFTGTLANVNAALNGLLFAPTPDFNGDTAGFTVAVTDQGNTGSGGALGDFKSVSITFTPVNDAPNNLVPAANIPAIENQPANVAGLLVRDIDAQDGDVMVVTLSAASGVLNLATNVVDGVTGAQVSGNGSGTLTITASKIAVNNTLNATGGLQFTAATPGDVTVTMTVNDQGATGSGGALSDSDTFTIAVAAFNDAPTITAPASDDTPEDTALVFNAANGNAISIADPDAGTGEVQVSLQAANGVLTLASFTGLTFVAPSDGTADKMMTFRGTLDNVNAALNGLIYLPDLDFSGSDMIGVAVDDQGNTGAGGAKTDAKNISVTVTAVNDPPTVNAPATASVVQDGSLVFDGMIGNAITVTDPDLPAAEEVRVSLQPTNGTLALGSTAGVTVTNGANGLVTIQGLLSAVNAAMNGLTFTPNSGFSGAAALGIMAFDDLGGTEQMDAAMVAITVGAVNAAPEITAPANDTTAEDTPRLFNAGNGNAITIADPDAGAIELEVILGVTNGTLALSGTTGITVVSGNAGGDSAMTFRGLLADVNAALNGLTYTPTQNFSGSATLTVSVNDRNTAATNGALSDQATVTIGVTAVNDAPAIAVPGAPQETQEDINLTLSTANGNRVSIADVDAGDAPLSVTISAARGTATLFATGGLTFTEGDGTTDAKMTFSGKLGDINAALDGLMFVPTPNLNGNSAGVTIDVTDGGATGLGGAKSDIQMVGVNVTAVNDAPVNQLPTAPQSTAANTPLVIGGIAVSDLDVETGDLVQVALSVVNGTVSLNGVAGLTFSDGDGTADSAMTFQGTLADVNAALNNLTFTPATGFAGPASLSVNTSDLGNRGAPGPLTDLDVLNIAVGGPNQPPVNGVPTTRNTNEDTPISFNAAASNAITVSDPDAGGAEVQVTLGVANGALTLGSVANLNFTVGSGTADASMTFTGTLVAVNNALEGLVYQPALNFNGADTLTITTNDQGNTGTGGAQSDTDTVTINVAAVDDQPTVSGPTAAEVIEDAMLEFSTAGGNGLSIVDVDSPGSTSILAQLNADNGTLELASTTGLTLIAGLTLFSGSIDDINNAVNGLKFTPNANYFGPAEVRFAVSGGDQRTVSVNVLPKNDAPSFTKGPNQTVNADAGLQTVTGWATAISVGPDNESSQTPSFQIVNVDKPGLFSTSPAISPTGTLTYLPNPAALTDTATITVRLSDGGGTANGGVDVSDDQTFTITVNGATNPNPVLATIGNLNIPELSNFNLQLSATAPGNPPLTFSMTLGAGFDNNNLPSLTTSGAFSWTPLETDNATQSMYSITFRVTNASNTALFDEETVQVTVQEVNSAPVFESLNSVTTIAGVPLQLTFSAEDRDLPAQGLVWSLSGGPAGNTAVINPASGAFSWTPAAGDVGVQNFMVTVTDNGNPNLSTTQPLSIDVRAANSPPVITLSMFQDTGRSATDRVSTLPDITGVLVYGGATLSAFTARFSDALPGRPDFDLLDPFLGIVQGTGNTRTFRLSLLELGDMRFSQNNTTFGNGTYTIDFVARDGAGQITNPAAQITLTYDDVAPGTPTAIVLDPAFRNGDGTANAQTVTINGVAEPNALVVINNTHSAIANGAGQFSVTGVMLQNANVATDLQVVAFDVAGNISGAASASFTFVPPPAPAPSGFLSAGNNNGGGAAEGADDAPAEVFGALAPPVAPPSGNHQDDDEDLLAALAAGAAATGGDSAAAHDDVLADEEDWDLTSLLLG